MINEEYIEKVFTSKDFFYNNGIVNIYNYLKGKKIEDLEYELYEDKLKLKFNIDNEDKLYNELLQNFIILNDIVCFTKNDREYWDDKRKDFVLDKKFDIKGKASGNDVKRGTYNYIKISETGISCEKVYEKFINFSKANNYKGTGFNSCKDKFFLDKKENRGFKKEKDISLVLYTTKQDAIKNFGKYLINELVMNSKIHTFEDGGFCFKDMINKNKDIINKWDALIYWYGCRTKRFYNLNDYNYYVFINSNNIKSLSNFKESLNINEESEEIRNSQDEVVKIATNIEIKQLKRININNPNFYISNSQDEFQIKVLIYLFSIIYNIDEDYNSKFADERRKKKKQEVYESLKYISFFTYTEDGTMKSSISEYLKTYKLFNFFEQLICISDKDEGHLLKYLSNIIGNISLSKLSNQKNFNIQKFCGNLLEFKSLRKNYYEAEYDSLKNNTRNLGKQLFEFEIEYLKFIEGSVDEMCLHEKSKIIGEGIGNFAAQIDDKNLLFSIRNIKNYKQLVSYFKDLKFYVLKNQENTNFTKDFIVEQSDIFEILEKEPEKWEFIRDYIAIYAIDKFKNVNYAKKMNGGK